MQCAFLCSALWCSCDEDRAKACYIGVSGKEAAQAQEYRALESVEGLVLISGFFLELTKHILLQSLALSTE